MRFQAWTLFAFGFLYSGWFCVAQAAPVLRCHFEVNAELSTHEFTPVSDPYPVRSIDLSERFRFKAVVLGDAQRVSLINVYVSHLAERQPMLMQHLKFVSPIPQHQPEPNALTGRVALYSPYQGKELVYGCALHEVSP
jgi:hypothetical protein